MSTKPNFQKTSKKYELLAKINKLQFSDTKHYTVKEAASILGKTEQSITNWCKSGKLAAIPLKYGSRFTFKIPKQVLIEYLNSLLAEQEVKRFQQKQDLKKYNHKSLLPNFEKACQQGLVGGKGKKKRPFSENTIRTYLFYLNGFVETYGTVNLDSLKQCLLDVPVEHFAKRKKIYEAVVCFLKFLIMEKLEDKAILAEVKEFVPERHTPLHRVTVDEKELLQLLDACESLLDRVIIIVLSSTGLRATEFCELKRRCINLEESTLFVEFRKGGKSRTLGLTQQGAGILSRYLAQNPHLKEDDFLFWNAAGKPLDRFGLAHRLEKISKRAQMKKVPPHALRRAFVTINANKGRSIVMLQHACDHADIQTTRHYCMTTEQEVVEAMKGWD